MTVTVCNVSKYYSKKTVLDNVSITFEEGKIHILLGENGAGKSTLAHIISGSVEISSGTLLLDEKPVVFKNEDGQKKALEYGIAIVHQNPHLAQSLTAQENLFLTGLQKNRAAWLNFCALKDVWAQTVPLHTPVKNLGGNQRFYVSLLASLLHNPTCLILDEPSAFLDIAEREELYKNLKEFCKAGGTVIVITHSWAEAEKYADRISILQKGQLVKTFSSAVDFKKEMLCTTEPSLRRNVSSFFLDESSKNVCLCFKHISARPKNLPALLDATFEVYYGGITAIVGLKEASLVTLENIVTGMYETAAQKGSILFYSANEESPRLLSGRTYSARFLRRHKVAIVPSNKTLRASNPCLTIEEMLCVYSATKDTVSFSKALIEKAGVCVTPKEKCSVLSGGMLQRLILERELSFCPKCFILCNPMQGLDKEAQAALLEKIVSMAKKGIAILIVGANDVPLSLCTNVYELEGGMLRFTFSKMGYK